MKPPVPDQEARIGRIADDLFRREGARLVAVLTGQLGVQRLQLAEDVVQESLVRALQTWPYRGVPDNPAAWLMQTAKHLALDQLRREKNWREKEEGIAIDHERWLSTPQVQDEHQGTFADDTLRMMFVCFHPQLSVEAQTALALRTLGGLSPAEIAAAFLCSEAAISKRLVRARQRIKELALPFAVPEARELPKRLNGVLSTLYLLFNEGYKASSGERLVREELCHEAIRLTSLLAEHPATATPKTFALLALMELNAARLSSRTDDMGNLLRLSEQDRGAWDQSMIQRGIRCLGLAASGDQLSEYHLEAGIAACHSTEADEAATDWPRILSLYDRLVEMTGSPIAALNRAVALARVSGTEAGLDALTELSGKGALESYHLFHAVLGSMHGDLGHTAEAIGHFRKAESLATLSSEREFITQQIRACEVD
jgi:RNA polymerase sigma factor (sigma-70 family)